MVSISEKVHGDFLTKSQYKNHYEEVCSFEMYLTFIKFIYSEKATKLLRNLHRKFDWHYIGQIYGDFAKFCGRLRIYELYFFGVRSIDCLKKILDQNSVEVYQKGNFEVDLLA